MKKDFWFACLLFILLFSCEDNWGGKNHEEIIIEQDRSNFHLAGDFYNRELILLEFNDCLLLREEVKSVYKTKIDSWYFWLDYGKPFKISLKTFYNGKVYLDTTFWVEHPNVDSSYKVTVTHPHPYDWERYYKGGIPIKSWGYLPIDSSIRFIHLRNY